MYSSFIRKHDVRCVSYQAYFNLFCHFTRNSIIFLKILICLKPLYDFYFFWKREKIGSKLLISIFFPSSWLVQSIEECEYLINLAKPHMQKSTVVDSATGKSKDSRFVLVILFCHHNVNFA